MTEESIGEIKARLAKEQEEFNARAERVLDQIKSNRSIQTKQHQEQAITAKISRISQFDLVRLLEDKTEGDYSAADRFQAMTEAPSQFLEGKARKTSPLEQLLAYEAARFPER